MERVGTPVAVEPCARLGFISPDGKFFPCCHCAHHDLGARLWNLFSYPGEYKGDYYLQLKGWVSIKAGGAITHKDQFDFLLCPFT
ncbi:hypothetical protein, partial [Streptomyces galilaeus]|uniref:hypothetical protein n=1 Tax=Streptomyces galilaeus TaxID=33899 RepID=UPI0038F6232A